MTPATLHALVVEDDSSWQQILTEILSDMGLAVDVASTVESAAASVHATAHRLAVALALQDTLGNLFAGLQIVASKQIRPGDYLLLDTTQEGTVVDIAWRTTTLRTQSDNMVIVPNAKLAQAIVTNYRLPAEPLSVLIEFGVSYEADLSRVEALAAEVATEVMAELHSLWNTTTAIRICRALEDFNITWAEDPIAKMDDVLEVAVIGVPDDKSGEAVRVIAAKQGA